MERKKAIKLTGFVGALCASATLVGISVSSTGAYFTDSHSGSISAGTGKIKVIVDPPSGQLNFGKVLPGEYQTLPVNYTAKTTGHEDVWLVFPNHGDASDAFSATPQAGPVPLGRYGHFAVTSTNGASFTSYNLASPGTGSSAGPSCATDAATGWGGSDAQPANPSDTSVAFCAPPQAILLASNLADGEGGTANLTFGFTPLLTDPQNAAPGPVEDFQIVATQHGIRPDNVFNG